MNNNPLQLNKQKLITREKSLKTFGGIRNSILNLEIN